MKRIITVLLLFCLLFPCFASCSSCGSSKKYETALALIESGDYAKARSILKELGNYKKSQEKLKCFYFVPVKCEMLDGGENESVSLTYSENNHLEKISFSASSDGSVYGYEFASDVVGNLLKLTEYDDDYTYSEEFTYDGKGHKIKHEIYHGEGLSRVYEWTYDEKGNEITEVITEANGSQRTKNSSYDVYGNLIYESSTDYSGALAVNEFEYDENGKILRSTHKVNDVLNYLYEYTYDPNGNMTKNICSNSTEVLYSYEYFYDSDGNQIKTVYERQSGKIQITEVTYDKNGNKTKESVSSNGSLEYSQEWTYDENGNVTKYVYEKNDGLISSTEEYVYDENGFLRKKLYTDNQGLWESFQYRRDEDGNAVGYKRIKNGETIEDVSIQYVLVYLPYDMPEWMEGYLPYFIFE